MMRPALGWAGLSRSALKRAEAQLLADSEGVRDEVGVLALHTAYANRFFPGTSVQQTRLRYALFVPWQIKALLRNREHVRSDQEARDALEQAELDLAMRLPHVDGEGTIGRRTASAGRSVAIPPSQSYWVALATWGVLGTDLGGEAPSRSELFRRWERWPEGYRRRPTTDDEGRALERLQYLFHQGLPEPPREFRGDVPLDFRLLIREREFLRKRLLDTKRSGDAQPSFLSALVNSSIRIREGLAPWSRSVIRHADEADRKALNRARDAAALAAVTRALYNAAVEALRERDEGSSIVERHRAHLVEIVDEYGAASQRLRLGELARDDVSIGDLETVLSSVQQWLSRGAGDPLDRELLASLGHWELRRKGSRRAKLPPSAHGREARAAWQAEKTALAEPIGYRWSLVCRFLRDLQE